MLCALYLVDCICTGMLLSLFVLCAVLPCHMAKLIECFLFQKPFVMNRLTYNCNAKPPTEISPMCGIPQWSGEWHIVLMTLFRLISIKWNGLFSYRLDYIRYLRMPYLIIIFKSVTILSCYIIGFTGCKRCDTALLSVFPICPDVLHTSSPRQLADNYTDSPERLYSSWWMQLHVSYVISWHFTV